MDFIKKHPYIITNIICAAAAVICCICAPLRQVFGSIFIMVLMSGFIVFPYLVIINFISFFVVITNNIEIGTVLSLLGGSVGSFIASQALDKKSKAVNLIFNISVWFVICVIAAGVIFAENDFRLVGF